MPAKDRSGTFERKTKAFSGWLMLFVALLVVAAGLAVMFSGSPGPGVPPPPARVFAGLAVIALGVFCFFGLFTLQPNEGRVLILFGQYHGTVRDSGFHWANPLYTRRRGRSSSPGMGAAMKAAGTPLGSLIREMRRHDTVVSLRARNFNSEQLKVNDKRGNPVEIAAVVVWRVDDTAQAVFDVDDYQAYVQVQSESAIRSIASLYAYDHADGDEPTLRAGGDHVSHELRKELEVRLAKAGVVVDEARLTHLAYAPEIAGAMLRRQQAEAVIAAREKIVLGAVSMVHMALRELDAQHVVQLDNERRAAMVSNLLVVLCGTSEASPVINAGTLYT